MTIQFEIGASAMLIGNDLQFVGVVDGARVRFILTGSALKRLANAVDLSPQAKFKAYDRHRAWIHETARRMYERDPAAKKVFKIQALDV